MFEELEKINTRPKPFEFYTASDLWAEEHTSRQMLSFHLNEEIDVSSRNAAFIDRSVDWIASHFKIGTRAKIADFGCGPGLYCALSPFQRRKLLSKFHTILKSGGSVLLDVYSLKAFKQREETAMYGANLLNRFWSPNKYYGFLNTFKYEKEKVVLDKYTIVEADRTRTVYNWLQYFGPGILERELVESGFKVEGFYLDVAGSPFDSENEEFAVVARKI